MAPPPPHSSVFKKHNAGTHLERRPLSLVHHIAVVEDKPFVHHKFAVAVSKGVSGGEEEEVPVLAHAKQTTDYEKLAPTWNLHKQTGSKPPLRHQRRGGVGAASVVNAQGRIPQTQLQHDENLVDPRREGRQREHFDNFQDRRAHALAKDDARKAALDLREALNKGNAAIAAAKKRQARDACLAKLNEPPPARTVLNGISERDALGTEPPTAPARRRPTTAPAVPFARPLVDQPIAVRTPADERNRRARQERWSAKQDHARRSKAPGIGRSPGIEPFADGGLQDEHAKGRPVGHRPTGVRADPVRDRTSEAFVRRMRAARSKHDDLQKKIGIQRTPGLE